MIEGAAERWSLPIIIGLSLCLPRSNPPSSLPAPPSCSPVMCPRGQKLVFSTYNSFLCFPHVSFNCKSGCWQLLGRAQLGNQGLPSAWQRPTLWHLLWPLCRMDANALGKKGRIWTPGQPTGWLDVSPWLQLVTLYILKGDWGYYWQPKGEGNKLDSIAGI